MRRALLLVCLFSILSGCAGMGGPRHVRYPNAVTPEAQAEFSAAKDLYMQRSFARADKALAQFIASAPYTQLTDEARFLRGEIAFIRKDYGAAVTNYRQAFSEIESPMVAPKARFKSALALHRLGRNAEAIGEVDGMYRRDASAVLRLRADSLGAVASKSAGKGLNDSVVWYLRVLDDYSEGATGSGAGLPGERIVTEAEALDAVRTWVNDKSVRAAQVETLPLKSMKGKRSGGYATYKLALAYHSEGNTDRAASLMKSFISGYPKHEYYAAARLLMGEMGGEIGDGAGVAVGVVLPLSGRYGVYGNSVLHGIECAIGLYEPCVGPGGVRLVVRDSASFPGGAVAAIEDIAKDRDVVAIIGPLQSAVAVAAARRANELGVPIISLSQREGVAELGEFAFRNSASMDSEVRTLLDYAIGRRKWKRFYVIYPDNRKGNEYYRLFSAQAEEMGGKVVSVRSYKPGQLQFVSDLRGRGAVEQVTMDSAIDLSTGVSYNAVFIPDSPWVVGSLLQMMMLSGDKRIQLLGIPRWNNPKFVERGGEYVEGAVFVDSFNKNAEDGYVGSFVTRFSEAYGVAPTLLEALGYDTMSMITASVRERGALGRGSMQSALAGMKGFQGVAGITTFDQNGDAKRKMYVLTISGGRIRSVK